jgi:hypothetical protein
MTLPATNISLGEIRDKIGASTASLDDPDVRRLFCKPRNGGGMYSDIHPEKEISLGDFRNTLATVNIGENPTLDAAGNASETHIVTYDPRGILESCVYYKNNVAYGVYWGCTPRAMGNYALDCGGAVGINAYAEPGNYVWEGFLGHAQSGQRYILDIYGWNAGYRIGTATSLLSHDIGNAAQQSLAFTVPVGYQWVTIYLGTYIRNQTNTGHASIVLNPITDRGCDYGWTQPVVRKV